jgi:alkylation response protein AidB-like acyl-CoA dehydrogenase
VSARRWTRAWLEIYKVTIVFDADLESPEDAKFRSEVRSFISENLTGDLLRMAREQTCSFGTPDITLPWQRLLHARGWVAASWPAEYGGPGWTPRQRYIFESEMALANAPRLPAMGLQMIGPVIIKYGTQAQKSLFLPRILSGEHYWCQGYSEPGAGSDLASLRFKAVRDGEEYVLNGTKLWTTYGHFANWIFLLVRTSTGRKPQEGITFLVAPMNSPGITIRPLTSLSGDHEVNQIFFDDVRVPVENRIGEEGQGWTVAKYLLEFERGVGHQVPSLFAELVRLRGIACREPGDEGGRQWDDIGFRRRFAELEIETLAAFFTEQRLVYSLPVGQNVGDGTAAIMKLAWSKLAQRIGHLSMDALGTYAAVDQSPSLGCEATEEVVGPSYGQTPTARYLNDRCLTIAGGSNEIQRNILARKLLGP